MNTLTIEKMNNAARMAVDDAIEQERLFHQAGGFGGSVSFSEAIDPNEVPTLTAEEVESMVAQSEANFGTSTATEGEIQRITDELLEADRLNSDIEADAGLVFKFMWPEYAKRVSGLSNKECKRLLLAVVGHPMEITAPKFGTKEAREAFELAKMLGDAKFILQQKAVDLSLKELAESEKLDLTNSNFEGTTIENTPLTEEVINEAVKGC